MASTAVPVIRQGWSCEELSLGEAGWTVIQVARGVVFDGSRLVLSDLAPTMPYVARGHLQLAVDGDGVRLDRVP